MTESSAYTEHPVFVETPTGPIGGLVTEPDSTPVAAAVVFGGLGATRSGHNSVFVRITRGLAELGVSSLRVDYAGRAESQCAPLRSISEGVEHSVRWFRARTPGLELLVVGHCYGLVHARSVALREPSLAGVAAISPAIEQTRTGERAMSVGRRVRVALHRARKAPGRALVHARYGRGPNEGRWSADDFELVDLPELVTSLAATGTAWFLTGEGDAVTTQLRALEPMMTEAGSTLDVVPFKIYPTPTPEAQDVVVARTLTWAQQLIRAVEPTA